MDWRIIIYLTLAISCSRYSCDKSEDTWTEMGRTTGMLLRDCWTRATRMAQEKHAALMMHCLQRRTLLALKRALSSDVIPLMDAVQLVKFRKGNGSINIRDSREYNSNMTFSEWEYQIVDAITNVFHTHTMQINIGDDNNKTKTVARLRRRNNIMPILMFGLVGLGMIMIPMGFQFLSVLGGKALLLAKLALILSSIQGLKKVATSNIHYGLYHSQQPQPWFDRKTEGSQHPYRLDDYYNQVPDPGADLQIPFVKRISSS